MTVRCWGLLMCNEWRRWTKNSDLIHRNVPKTGSLSDCYSHPNFPRMPWASPLRMKNKQTAGKTFIFSNSSPNKKGPGKIHGQPQNNILLSITPHWKAFPEPRGTLHAIPLSHRPAGVHGESQSSGLIRAQSLEESALVIHHDQPIALPLPNTETIARAECIGQR